MIKELIKRLKYRKEQKNNSNYDNSTLIYATHLQNLTEYFLDKQSLKTTISDYDNIKSLEVSYTKKSNCVIVKERCVFLDEIYISNEYTSPIDFKNIAEVFALNNFYCNNSNKINSNSLKDIIRCSNLKYLNNLQNKGVDLFKILKNKRAIHEIVYNETFAVNSVTKKF